MKHRPWWAQCCVLLVLYSLFLIQCKNQTISSQWARESVDIDGLAHEWESALYYDESMDISYGVQNDDQFLYIALVTANETLQRHMMMSGLVLWLDENGGKEKNIGFKFPRGLVEQGMPSRDVMETLRNPEGTINEAQLQDFINQSFSDIQLLDKKGQNIDVYTQRSANEQNIQFALKYSQGRLVYELRIPRQGEKHPWYFTVENIGIGFETPKMDQGDHSQMRDMKAGAGMMDAGRGGRGGGRGGMGGPSGGRSGGFSTSKPLKVWMTATLATE